jgi:methyl-accepting chemotaxis protein
MDEQKNTQETAENVETTVAGTEAVTETAENVEVEAKEASKEETNK